MPQGVGRAHRALALSPSSVLGAAIIAAYATTIVIGAAHHELWRDEVVPLSIAREMPSFSEVWRMVRHEGHPILWYVILRYSYFVFGSTAVLPVASVLIAIAAIVVFVTQARLPLWLKALFVFGYIPIFEYSVLARANGLAMLLLFAFCALYAARERYRISAALALGALANTSAMGFVTAAGAGAMVAVDAIIASRHGERPTRRALLATAVYVAGLAHAVVANAPDPSTLPLPLYHHSVATVVAAVRNAILSPAAHSASFLWIPLTSVWLWLAFAFLWRRPGLLAFLALSLIGFELLFTLVYPASPRQKGYVLLVVIATVWLWNALARHGVPEAAGTLARAERWLGRVLLVSLTVTLGYQVVLGMRNVVDDVRFEYASSRRLGSLIASDPRLERAIVIGEPEDLTESLPYYRDNRIYLPQEKAFRHWLMWIPGGRRGDYNLAELLATATELRGRYDTPVVMALGWWLDGRDAQRMYAGTYVEQNFTMSAADREEFLARTEFLGRLRDATFTDENYDVFVLW